MTRPTHLSEEAQNPCQHSVENSTFEAQFCPSTSCWNIKIHMKEWMS